MENFTPISSTIGGVLIGLSAVLFLLWHGRIAGISGILGGSLATTKAGDVGWRIAFLGGLIIGGIALSFLHPTGFAVTVERSPAALIVAGLLVGFGTQLGSGCTSGHGVCGIGRLSTRSIVATCTFMAAGAASAAIVTHLLGGSL